MIIHTRFKHTSYEIDLDQGTDLSIPIKRNQQVNAFHIADAQFEYYQSGDFIASVRQGGAINCEYVRYNPHGNGTHTEGLGHVANYDHFISNFFSGYQGMCYVLSVAPEKLVNGDRVIQKTAVMDILAKEDLAGVKAIAIRSLPNPIDKLSERYSGNNPVYLSAELTKTLRYKGYEHLLVDLPSVDKEEDGGQLLAHKAWWNYPHDPRPNATITEFIYVPDHIVDGLYWLNLQSASVQSDAAPSRPTIFPLKPWL